MADPKITPSEMEAAIQEYLREQTMPLYARTLPDGREVEVWRLTYNRARTTIRDPGARIVLDSW